MWLTLFITRVNKLMSKLWENTLLSIKAGDWSELAVCSFPPSKRQHVSKRDRRYKGSLSFFYLPSAAWWFDVSAPPPLPDTKGQGPGGHFAFIRLNQLQSHHYGDATNERDKEAGVLCVHCRCLEGTGSSLVVECFAFYGRKEKMDDISGSFWLMSSCIWSIGDFGVLN